jgi:hypothetical protein
MNKTDLETFAREVAKTHNPAQITAAMALLVRPCAQKTANLNSIPRAIDTVILSRSWLKSTKHALPQWMTRYSFSMHKA